MATIKEDLTPMISAFLFFNPDSPAVLHEEYIEMKVKIRQMLKTPLNRRVMTEILMDLRKDLSGDVQDQVFHLYQDLGLHMDAFKKLQSWRWELVSKGIEELTEMRVTHAYTFIRKFVNDRRSVIRKQAQLATVTLKPEGIAYFLDTAKYRISEWQQLSLLDVLRHKEDFDPPQFKSWLISVNKDVVLFALRLIKFYNQSEGREELTALAKHRNNQVKLEAIECIDKFHIYEALDTLKGIFNKCNTDVKLAILTTIANMGSEAELDFLETVAKGDPNFIIRTKALGSINAVTPGMVIPSENLEELETAPQPEELPAVPHVPFPEVEVSEANSEEDFEAEDLEFLMEEDEAIFDACFLEELKDILADTNPAEPESEILPLHFLPFVLNEGEDEPQMYISKVPVWELEVQAEEIKVLGEKELYQPTPPRETPEIEVDWDNELARFEERILTDGFVEEPGLAFTDPGEQADGDDPEKTADIAEPAGAHKECKGKPDRARDKSIFATLFHKSDRDGKLMLLDEIGKIGGEKELQFLNSVNDGEHPHVIQKATEIRALIERRFCEPKSGEVQTMEALEELQEEAFERNDVYHLMFEPDPLQAVPGEDLREERDGQMGFSLKNLFAGWRKIFEKN